MRDFELVKEALNRTRLEVIDLAIDLSRVGRKYGNPKLDVNDVLNVHDVLAVFAAKLDEVERENDRK